MWWNFIAATHENIHQAARQWQARLREVRGSTGATARLKAPPLPAVRLRLRRCART